MPRILLKRLGPFSLVSTLRRSFSIASISFSAAATSVGRGMGSPLMGSGSLYSFLLSIGVGCTPAPPVGSVGAGPAPSTPRCSVPSIPSVVGSSSAARTGTGTPVPLVGSLGLATSSSPFVVGVVCVVSRFNWGTSSPLLF